MYDEPEFDEFGYRYMDEDVARELFHDWLEVAYPQYEIFGIVMTAADVADILEDRDPIAYREAFNEWLDSEEMVVR